MKSSNLKRKKELYREWRRQQRRIKQSKERYRAGGLLTNPPDQSYIQEINRYWRIHYGKTIEPIWHLALGEVTGCKDPRFISSQLWWEEILPVFNDLPLRPAFRDKNLSEIFLPYAPGPNTILKRINGHYLNANNNLINPEEAEKLLRLSQDRWIIKPSQTDDGYGIAELGSTEEHLEFKQEPCTFQDLEHEYGKNFLIQEKIAQHPVLAAPHEQSVNTIRIVSFRWKEEIIILLTFARFGVKGKLTDNAGTGGLCCGINKHGHLNRVAVDKTGKSYSRHPTSDYDFNQQVEIPGHQESCKLAITLHQHIYHFDIISWDFAIDINGKPLFLEINFRGAVDIYQFAGGRPLFGDLTDEVIAHVKQHHNKD